MAAVIGGPDGPRPAALAELLPHKYVGNKWTPAPTHRKRTSA
ncbi:hypothetical protein [Nonomuraea sp. NPDC003754]